MHNSVTNSERHAGMPVVSAYLAPIAYLPPAHSPVNSSVSQPANMPGAVMCLDATLVTKDIAASTDGRWTTFATKSTVFGTHRQRPKDSAL